MAYLYGSAVVFEEARVYLRTGVVAFSFYVVARPGWLCWALSLYVFVAPSTRTPAHGCILSSPVRAEKACGKQSLVDGVGGCCRLRCVFSTFFFYVSVGKGAHQA